MPLPEIEFTWHRPKDGHKWVGNLLTDGLPPGAVTVLGKESIASLKDRPALFLDFAHLTPTRDAIKAFADVYGSLGLRPQNEVRIETEDGHTWTANGERLASWEREIRAMREAVYLWDATRYRTPGLARTVRWERGISKAEQQTLRSSLESAGHEPAVIEATVRSQGAIARVSRVMPDGRTSDPIWWPQDVRVPSAPDDLAMAGWTILLSDVSGRLKQINAGLVWDVEAGHPILQLKPATLLDAMWLQFSRAIAHEDTFKRCENPRCRKHFRASSEDSRRQYCPDRPACKMAASRARRRG